MLKIFFFTSVQGIKITISIWQFIYCKAPYNWVSNDELIYLKAYIESVITNSRKIGTEITPLKYLKEI